MQIFHNAKFDFIRWRWHAIAASMIVIVAGAVAIATQGMRLGIDFSGGTQLIVKFDQPAALDKVRAAVEPFPGDEVVQQYDKPETRQVLIRLQQSGAEQGASLEQTSKQVQAALSKAGLPTFTIAGRDLVGPTVGKDLQRRGIYATIASLLAITIYIGVRFRFSFAVGAIAATLHDVFVTLAFLQFFGYEMSLNVVAGILTITGYSVNDTIVIFDRVRENVRLMRREGLDHVVNLSVNQTLGRTIITAGATFLAVLSLFILGGEVLRGFAFTMIVGIISGTYSTVFIASSIAILLSQGRRRTVASATPAATSPTGSSKAATSPSGSSKKKRAS
jgi:preprotein translocase subunit SecF